MNPRDILVNNLDRPITSPVVVRYCDSFLCRLRGLTFRKHLSPNDGLLLVQGAKDSYLDSSIHMFFVWFTISVFWINSNMIVVDKTFAKPWRPAYFSKKPARYVLELHPDRWKDYRIGERVEFQDA